jgi:hypothetical protein
MREVDLTVRPPNALLIVGDARGDPPGVSSGHQLVHATSTCLAIGTLVDADGETRVRVRDLSASTAGRPERLVFDGVVGLPTRKLRVGNVWLDSYVDLAVNVDSVRLQVWVNHPSEPDEVWILVCLAIPEVSDRPADGGEKPRSRRSRP